jgi:hypothetical protein
MSSQRLIEERRLVLLQILARLPTYSANADVLYCEIEECAVPGTYDEMMDDLRWLARAHCLTLETIAMKVTVATLTQGGQEVATGRNVIEGVMRPRPKRI